MLIYIKESINKKKNNQNFTLIFMEIDASRKNFYGKGYSQGIFNSELSEPIQKEKL